jgi:hypothetical protein
MTVTGDKENHRDSVATGTDFMKLWQNVQCLRLDIVRGALEKAIVTI